MSTTTAELLEKVMTLPPDERRALAEQLWEVVESPDADPFPLTPEQAEELDLRLAEHEANPHDHMPWEEFKAQLLASRRSQ